MKEKKQLVPRKHIGKKVSSEQEKEIKQVQDNMTKNRGGKPVAWMEAKHEFFEKEERQQDYYLGSKKHQDNLRSVGKLIEIQKNQKEVLNRSAVPKQILGAGVNDAPKKKSVMTIAETKLGVTMVLSKEECKKLRIKETTTTKEAIQDIRKRLGLPWKSMESMKGGDKHGRKHRKIA